MSLNYEFSFAWGAWDAFDANKFDFVMEIHSIYLAGIVDVEIGNFLVKSGLNERVFRTFCTKIQELNA